MVNRASESVRIQGESEQLFFKWDMGITLVFKDEAQGC